MPKRPLRLFIILLVSLLLVSCASEPPPPTPTPSPLPPTPVPSETPFVSVGTDINISLPEGDAERGFRQAQQRGCLACHGTGGVGPAYEATEGIPGIGERAESRYLQDDYTGMATSAEQYLLESIVQPSAHIVDGYADGIMIPQSGLLMSAQDVADVIAYLLDIR